MNREEVLLLELKNDETRNKMALNLKLYGFDLTMEDLEKLLTLDENSLTFDNGRSGYSNENVQMVSVKKIFMNKRGTLKLVIWRNGKFSCFNRDAKPTSMSMLSIPYDYNATEVWDDLKEGMYVAFAHGNWEHEVRLGKLTDCKSRTQAEKWMTLYTDCLKKKYDFSNYEEMQNCKSLKSEGMLTIKELEDHKLLMESTIAQIQKAENQEATDKDTALKTKIAISGSKICIKALDDHTYLIIAPSGHQWKKEDWTEFIYRHRYSWKPHDQQYLKEQTLYDDVMKKLVVTPLEWFKLSVDGKPTVKISIKKITNKRNQEVQLTYLNDRKVAYDDMYQAVYKYFMQGQNLDNPAEQPENLDEAEKQKILEVRKLRDEGIITSGITGYITDLEGETPITIGFEKIGVSWHLVIGEKKIQLKGGVETIKSLERVLKGTAQGYKARHSTAEFFERLCKVLNPEDAIEVIEAAKEFGKLTKALEIKGQKQ